MKRFFSLSLSTLILAALILASLAPLTAPPAIARIPGGSGPGNGTDYVKVLFAEAQSELNSELASVNPESVPALGLPSEFQDWLLERPQGSARLIQLKYYLKKIELRFQDNPPCHDEVGNRATICFIQGERGQPVVVAAIEENRLTTREQAKAMLIHEAGHFTGEMNHLFLDDLGIALVAALGQAQVIAVEVQSTEIVPNVFVAKDGCDQGTSRQALTLKALAHQRIGETCARQKRSCDLSQIEYVFQGDNSWRDGQGFTMKVTCVLRATLKAR